ncbi:MAG TPA: lysophospholipid acyltransferase family protein [Ignavibacteria bacterium]|nr:lysophospholipid acyltransferase family protein [Ignavibacteria bacterium]
MKKLSDIAGIYILPFIINIFLKTLRINIKNLPDLNSRSVYIFWHSKMLVGWWLFKNADTAALVSQSKDGEILSKILKNWKYKIVRGSSSKGSKEAISELLILAENNSIAITPDGPRGPANSIKNGALIISNKLKIPVIPVKIIYRKKFILSKSWDKFEIPYPFSKCEVYFGNKYVYENYLEEKELNEFKETLSKEM